MSTRDFRDLQRRARALGIQTGFIDSSGQRRVASAETLRAMIQLLGEEISGAPAIPPVIVCWDGKLRSVALTAMRASCTSASLLPVLAEENCQERAPRVQVVRGANSSATVQLPPLPFGYYELHVRNGGRAHKSLVISAPGKAYAKPGFRAWGIFAPMYALHSRESWGAGNLSDWQQLCESLASHTTRTPRASDRRQRNQIKTHGNRVANTVAATLPLLGAFLERWKCEPSPYSPATRLFWNEFYIDVTRVPEFIASRSAQRMVNSTPFQRQLAKFRWNNLVDYAAEMAFKRRALEQLAAGFFQKQSLRRGAFDMFTKQHTELNRYAAFRATCEERREPWRLWPEHLRNGHLGQADANEQTKRYFMFVQWLVQEQMDQVLAICRARGANFYLDLPLGVDPDGYDVWANQKLFAHDASVGSPPDLFFTKGQDWGFPPLHPQRVREDGYRYVIDYLRFQMRHTGLLRLDHVMGLHRLWWVPRGASAADGAYVSYNAEELYAILCLESHRHQTMLVGENLGTVPPEVNRSMKRHGLRTMYVVQYEAQPNARPPLREPPRDCVASLNTHDMPAFAAFWKGLDISDRQQLGLLKAKAARQERKRRRHLREVLVKFLNHKLQCGKDALPCPAKAASTHHVLLALLTFLARSKAEVVLVNLEDLWLEKKPQNTPGTSTERVNWKRKMKLTLNDCLSRNGVRESFAALQR